MRHWLGLLSILYASSSWAARPVLRPIHFPFDQLGRTPMKLEPAFKNVKFDRPIFLTPVPGTRDLLAVVELSGKIKLIQDHAYSTETFLLLDLKDHITARDEEGLLGFAFSPSFQNDGIFYVYYSPSRRRYDDRPSMVLSQFQARATSRAFEAHHSSEKRLLEIPQPANNHKGGMLAFWGDDLYIGVGDGGGWDDKGENRHHDKTSHNNGQNLRTLLGKILRIRPDGKGAYSIPTDNPFRGHPTFRPEIFAFGIRNPWRFSFDRRTGQLWLGDVGQDTSEEINIVERGDNLGWSIFEGKGKCPRCDPNQELVGGVHKEPLLAYDHTLGKSITGGYVYRGSALSELNGKYIFGDFVAGKVWMLDFAGAGAKPEMIELVQSSNVASLGENHGGELYVISMREGIMRFKRDDATQNRVIPRYLSRTGLFEDTKNLIPQSGLTEYDVNSPLWSDGASKRRFIALPDGQQMQFQSNSYWELPNRTVLVKHFELPRSALRSHKIETRVLIKSNDKWAAFTYLWNDEQTDAELVLEGATKDYEVWNESQKQVLTQRWVVPTQNQCFQCHTQNANIALGISTPQLNKDSQLKKLGDLQLLSGLEMNDLGHLPKLADPQDTRLQLASRAKSYLHAQCFHCHMPQGTTPSSIDLRYFAATENLYRPPSLGSGGMEDMLIIKPGRVDRSVLYHRFLRTNASTAMPPLGVQTLDKRGADLLKEWIESLDP